MSTAAAPAPTVILALDTATPWLTLALRSPPGQRRASVSQG
ncbi:tRNA (adenosine(37)-N6)-threonylcarbamoyltransferase complex dimerization subunit type 1 TsaB, partial [Deinococcus sp. 6GRE01]|nr:tRNA (adenosine(37)-N6)-threonylcarbamoyltransferase complex dimerization subunit type 1 TsaB [Deinococcus sp. 6GRE01]